MVTKTDAYQAWITMALGNIRYEMDSIDEHWKEIGRQLAKIEDLVRKIKEANGKGEQVK